MDFTIPSVVSQALGLEPCVFTMWTIAPYLTMFALFISLFYRHRAIIFHSYYSKPGRTAPDTRFSAVPYESVIALLLAAPRAFTTVPLTSQDFRLENIKHELLEGFSWMHWGLVAYIILLDAFERRQWYKRTLSVYFFNKTHSPAEVVVAVTETTPLTKEVSEDLRTDSSDPEKQALASEPVPTRRSLRQRIMAAFSAPYERQRLTALNIAATYQVMAYAKIMCANVFLLNTSTFSCLASRDQASNLGSTLPWTLITIIAALRGVTLMIEGYRFAKNEVKQ